MRSPRRLRIAAVIDTYLVSGPGRQLAALAGGLAPHGVELHVVMFHRAGRPRPPYAEYLERAQVGHTVLPEHGPFDLRLVGALRRTLEALAPDVVQTHSYKTNAQLALLRRGGARWPWVAFFHGATTENLKVRAYNWLDRKAMVRADRLVVMSQAHLRDVAGRPERARVIHNAAIPLPREGAPVDVSAQRAPGIPLLGVVGRLSSEKGVDVFLNALASLGDRGVAATAVIAGDGPDRAALEQLAGQLGLGDRVRFLGNVPAVWSLYPQLDLVVLPSRSEGLPNVLLEALRADVPAVATAVGAVPEVLTDPAAGLVVPPDDPAALAAAIVRALPLGADEGARRARAETAERFSIERRVEEHVRLYAELAPTAGGAGDARRSERPAASRDAAG